MSSSPKTHLPQEKKNGLKYKMDSIAQYPKSNLD